MSTTQTLKLLREENEELREQLKSLSAQLDLEIEKKPQKLPSRTSPDESRSKHSYQTKIKSLEKEIQNLEALVAAQSVENQVKLFQEIDEKEKTLKELIKQINNLKVQIARHTPEDLSGPYRILQDELKQARGIYKELDERYNRELTFHQNVMARLSDLKKVPIEKKHKEPKEEDFSEEIQTKKKEIIDMINEKNDIQVKYRKHLEELRKQCENQVKVNQLMNNQIKSTEQSCSHFDTQLRITKQQRKNLSRNPLVPSLMSETTPHEVKFIEGDKTHDVDLIEASRTHDAKFIDADKSHDLEVSENDLSHKVKYIENNETLDIQPTDRGF